MNDGTFRTFENQGERGTRRSALLKRKLEALGIRVTEEHATSWLLELPDTWEMPEQLDLDGILLDLEDQGIAVRTP